jgi:hypothetical protein
MKTFIKYLIFNLCVYFIISLIALDIFWIKVFLIQTNGYLALSVIFLSGNFVFYTKDYGL